MESPSEVVMPDFRRGHVFWGTVIPQFIRLGYHLVCVGGGEPFHEAEGYAVKRIQQQNTRYGCLDDWLKGEWCASGIFVI